MKVISEFHRDMLRYYYEVTGRHAGNHHPRYTLGGLRYTLGGLLDAIQAAEEGRLAKFEMTVFGRIIDGNVLARKGGKQCTKKRLNIKRLYFRYAETWMKAAKQQDPVVLRML